MDGANGHAASDALAQPYHRRVGDHHAERGARHHPQVGVVLRGQHDGGDLGLVAHFGQEECDHGGAKHPPAWRSVGFAFVQLVGDQHPHRHGDERCTQDPAQYLGAEERGHPGTQSPGQAVVHQGRHQDAKHDRPGFAKTCGQHEREQLRLVAHLGERDDGGRNEEGFHGGGGPIRPDGWKTH